MVESPFDDDWLAKAELQMSDKTSQPLTVMLQEQNQYREEVRMFDSHLFKVLLTYVTGLIAAFGWLGSQVLERSAHLVDAAAAATPAHQLSMGTAVGQVFAELARGPFFYLFTGVPTITAIMFLVVARDWASLNEKFHYLKDVGDRIAKALADPGDSAPPDVLMLDRGASVQGRSIRAMIEGTLFLFWLIVALGLSLIILLSVAGSANSVPRRIWYVGAGWLGLGLGLTSIIVAGITFLKRRYRGKPDSELGGD